MAGSSRIIANFITHVPSTEYRNLQSYSTTLPKNQLEF